MGLLFWFLVSCAAGFARYFFLARENGEGPLASVAALMELFGLLP